MKKLIIIDGNENDESHVKSAVGEGYDVSSLSFYDVNNMALSTVITIANTVDSHDAYSSGRSLRVAVIARDIARNLGWDDKECQNIYFVALLHDIGMMIVPDAILYKPGRLTDEEYSVVKGHPQKGAEMLRDIKALDHLFEGVLYHHERWDGGGYPKGLSGEDIPKYARVIAIADAYDAMNSDKVYRSRLTQEKIISEFTRCKGSQFDPDMADVFIFMLKDGYTVEAGIEQTKEASKRAAAQGGMKNLFFAEEPLDPAIEMDALTGLFTRSYLNTRVGKKISEERSGALMLIDVTGFENITEKFGAKEGDTLLKALSDRFKTFFREADIVCRIDDNRFAVFVSGESGKSVIGKKAGVITGILETYEEFEKYRALSGISIGISMCQEDGVTFEELYGAALAALDRAKQNDNSTYRFSQGEE